MKARVFSLFAILCLFAVSALAENATDIRHRMEKRLPQIDALQGPGSRGRDQSGVS